MFLLAQLRCYLFHPFKLGVSKDLWKLELMVSLHLSRNNRHLSHLWALNSYPMDQIAILDSGYLLG